MLKLDLENQLKISQLIDPVLRTSSVNGSSVNRATNNSGSVAFVFHQGAITDGTHTPKLQESDDDSSWSDVAAGDYTTALAALVADAQQATSYKGTKQYVRPVITITGSPSTGAISGCVAVEARGNLG